MNSSFNDQSENNITDWDKPKLYRLKDDEHNKDRNLVVLSNGNHVGSTFQGTVVYQYEAHRTVGEICAAFAKDSFLELDKDSSVTLSN